MATEVITLDLKLDRHSRPEKAHKFRNKIPSSTYSVCMETRASFLRSPASLPRRQALRSSCKQLLCLECLRPLTRNHACIFCTRCLQKSVKEPSVSIYTPRKSPDQSRASSGHSYSRVLANHHTALWDGTEGNQPDESETESTNRNTSATRSRQQAAGTLPRIQRQRADARDISDPNNDMVSWDQEEVDSTGRPKTPMSTRGGEILVNSSLGFYDVLPTKKTHPGAVGLMEKRKFIWTELKDKVQELDRKPSRCGLCSRLQARRPTQAYCVHCRHHLCQEHIKLHTTLSLFKHHALIQLTHGVNKALI